MDEDGYPDEAELAKVREWPAEDPRGLLAYVKTLWWMPDWGWSEQEINERHDRCTLYRISTGGWSGNERIIEAMEANVVFWLLCWYSSRRGGHYEFRAR